MVAAHSQYQPKLIGLGGNRGDGGDDARDSCGMGASRLGYSSGLDCADFGVDDESEGSSRMSPFDQEGKMNWELDL